jgi:hypothetical protein
MSDETTEILFMQYLWTGCKAEGTMISTVEFWEDNESSFFMRNRDCA